MKKASPQAGLRRAARRTRPAAAPRTRSRRAARRVTVLPASDAVGTALPRIAALICAAVEPGWLAAYSATAPVTCGVAIEVPLYEP